MGITPKVILGIIAKYFSSTRKEIFSNTRKRHVMTKRQLFFYFCTIYTDTSYEEIGYIAMKYNRSTPFNHATIVHSKKTIVNLIETDKAIRTHAEHIAKAIESRRKIPNLNFDIEETISKMENRLSYLEEKLKTYHVA